jgi:hypothetical protein
MISVIEEIRRLDFISHSHTFILHLCGASAAERGVAALIRSR